jgi:hypothetical protein
VTRALLLILKKITLFCTQQNIRVIKSPPGCPESNVLVERGVKTDNGTLRKQVISLVAQGKSLAVKEHLLSYLQQHSDTPTTVTGKSPAEMMLKFIPCTPLADLTIRPPPNVNLTGKQPHDYN